MLILDISKWHYEIKVNEIESLLHQSSIAQLVERLVLVWEVPRTNLGFPSVFCFFLIYIYLYYIYLYASGIVSLNSIDSLLQQSSLAQLVERLISVREVPRSNLGLPSGFCSFKILNYNAAKCL